MKVHLYGGFGEKGRTCIGIECGSARLLLDAGIKTDDHPRTGYPALTPGELKQLTAIVVSHAHEDHAGALGWCMANGFGGDVWMTGETAQDFATTCADYLEPAHKTPASQLAIRKFASGEALQFGELTVTSGRSGHAVGGVWLAVQQGAQTLLYCADVVPRSPLLVMDPLPECTLALIDASYGDDPVPAAFRARQIADWINAHPGTCLLPTPLIGRSLELLLAIPTPLSVHADMIDTLSAQLQKNIWFQPGTVELLGRRLAAANHWHDGDDWPGQPLLCHDGMGLGGPSEQLIPRARAEQLPILFTGHLPIGSPGEHAMAAGAADFIRLPTHPTRDENIAMVKACNADRIVGHSCTAEALEALAPHLPIALERAATGDHLDL